MPTNLILNTTNYTDINLTNQKSYTNGGGYACNYPLDIATTFSLDVTLGSIYVTAAAGDFYDLLGCDIQNNNVPVRKWLAGDAGAILEIDYIISSTEAVLKEPCSYSIVGLTFAVVDYWGQPQVQETVLADVNGLGSPFVLVNTKIGPLAINLGTAQSVELGSEPISVDLASSGSGCEITVTYQS
jgi:hypothetical protein